MLLHKLTEAFRNINTLQQSWVTLNCSTTKDVYAALFEKAPPANFPDFYKQMTVWLRGINEKAERKGYHDSVFIYFVCREQIVSGYSNFSLFK